MNLFVFRIASSAKEKSPDRPDHACNGARTGPSVALRGAQREHGGGGAGAPQGAGKDGEVLRSEILREKQPHHTLRGSKERGSGLTFHMWGGGGGPSGDSPLSLCPHTSYFLDWPRACRVLPKAVCLHSHGQRLAVLDVPGAAAVLVK